MASSHDICIGWPWSFLCAVVMLSHLTNNDTELGLVIELDLCFMDIDAYAPAINQDECPRQLQLFGDQHCISIFVDNMRQRQ